MNPLRRPLEQGLPLVGTAALFALFLANGIWFLVRSDTSPSWMHWGALALNVAMLDLLTDRLVRFWRARQQRPYGRVGR